MTKNCPHTNPYTSFAHIGFLSLSLSLSPPPQPQHRQQEREKAKSERLYYKNDTNIFYKFKLLMQLIKKKKKKKASHVIEKPLGLKSI
jgi:hypothetical protein